MVKIFSILRRKKGLTHEEFLRHWDERHGPLAARMLPQIRKLIHYHPLGPAEGGDFPIDGIAEAWVDDLEAFQALSGRYQGEAAREVREDDTTFVDEETSVHLVMEMKVIKD